MSSIWIDSRHMAVRKYTATATGTKAVVRIEIEVDDPGALGYLLKELGEAQRDVARDRQAAEATLGATRRDKAARGITKQSLLMLPYYGDERCMTAIIAAIHAGLRQLGIKEDDDKRALYARVTGERRLTNMTPRQHDAIVAELRRLGFKPAKKALEGPFAGKLQALWIDAWNLGIVRNRRDEALAAFVKGRTRIDHTRWVIHAGDADKAIEALKGWMARDGGVDWSVGTATPDWERKLGAKIALAQWRRLGRDDGPESFKAFCDMVYAHRQKALEAMDNDDWVFVMNALGRQVRKAVK